MSDRGSGTLLGLVASLLLLSGGAIAGAITSLTATHQRASVAADLSALAAAQAGCHEAARVAILNGGVVVSCDIEGSDAIVEVEFPGPSVLSRLGVQNIRVSASARAGQQQVE